MVFSFLLLILLSDLAFEVAVAIACVLLPRLRSCPDNSVAIDSNVSGFEHIRLIRRSFYMEHFCCSIPTQVDYATHRPTDPVAV